MPQDQAREAQTGQEVAQGPPVLGMEPSPEGAGMVTPTADTIATVQLRQEGSDRATEKGTGARTLAIAISPRSPEGPGVFSQCTIPSRQMLSQRFGQNTVVKG